MSVLGSLLRSGSRAGPSRNSSNDPSPPPSAAPSRPGSSGGTAATNMSAFSTAPAEAASLELALRAASILIDDDIEGAETLLRAGSESAYRDLGLSVISSLQAVTGLEPHLIAEAAERSRACEKSSLRQWRDAEAAFPEIRGGLRAWQPRPGRFYPPGTGYRVVNAASQLFHAVTAVLDESDKLERLGAAVKAFLRLRKAYANLSEIIEFERRIAAGPADPAELERQQQRQRQLLAAARMPGGFDDEAVDNILAAQQQPPPPQPQPSPARLHLAVDNHCYSSSKSSGNSNSSSETARQQQHQHQHQQHQRPHSPPPTPTSATGDIRPNPLDDMTDPVDIFVHSAANMAFGALQLVLGALPPAYRPLLAVAGFRGDRERGLSMLWRASSHPDFCGSLAGLILMAYYTSLASFSDILPSGQDADEDVDGAGLVGYPEARVSRLLAQIRTSHPRGMLWRIVEARVLADQRRLPDAIRILSSEPKSQLRQVAAVTWWQLALDTAFVRDWATTRHAFLTCVELNDWTHALYYYCAGAAELELYRDAVAAGRPDAERRRHRDAAEELIRRAPPLVGRHRVMMRRIPHEVFVERRVARWEARARALGLSLADAIGASPIQEITYIWNGAKKLTGPEAEAALADMSWGRCTAPPAATAAIAAMPEEAAVRGLCASALLRRLERFDEARAVLQDEVICQDRTLHVFKKEYVMPMATYEMAVIAWAEACAIAARPGGDGEPARRLRREKADECDLWLSRACRWPDRYLMDGRFGLRFQAGIATLAWNKQRAV